MEKTEFSAGGIILNRDNVLLVYQESTNTWAFPKGHMKDSESELETARREILEETGLIDIKLIKKLGSYTRGTKKSTNILKHITMFLFSTSKKYVYSKYKEIGDIRWVSVNEVTHTLAYPEDIEFFLDVIRATKLPDTNYSDKYL